MPIPPYAPTHPLMVTLPPRTMLTTPANSCSSATPVTTLQVLTQNAAQHPLNLDNAPVLIAVVSDSDTTLLLADSPGGHQWVARLNDLDNSTPSDAVAGVAVAWGAEAGQTVDTETVREALCAADRDNRAADQAMLDAAGDIARMCEMVGASHQPGAHPLSQLTRSALGEGVPWSGTGDRKRLRTLRFVRILFDSNRLRILVAPFGPLCRL
jgi:hypothetical protein